MSSKKECFFFLLIWNWLSIAVLCLKFWFYVFDTTKFHIFYFLIFAQFSRFLVLSRCHISDRSHITLLAIKKKHNWSYKKLKDIYYGFNGIDITFLKKLIEFFVVNCCFCVGVLVIWHFLCKDFINFPWKNRWVKFLILVDSWWLSSLWKQLFSKRKKIFLSSQFYFFHCLFLPSPVKPLIRGEVWNYWYQWKVSKGICVAKSIACKNSLWKLN